MGEALPGVVIIVMPVLLASWMAFRLRREGESVRPAIRFLTRSGCFCAGLLLIAMAVSRPLGAFVLSVLFVLLGIAVIRVRLRLPGAIAGLPQTFHNLGDPAAWRGQR